MHHCEFCQKQVIAGEKANKILCEARQKFYRDGSIGWEIVKERIACLECVESGRVASVAHPPTKRKPPVPESEKKDSSYRGRARERR